MGNWMKNICSQQQSVCIKIKFQIKMIKAIYRLLQPFSTALLFLFSLNWMANGGEYDLTVEVPPGKFECFFQPIQEKHKSMEIYYQVIDGGDLNVNFMLILNENVLKQDQMKTDGDHKIDINQPGDYQICFDNSFSYQARKVVFFEIYLYDGDGNLEEEDLSKFGNKKTDALLQEKMKQLGMTIEQFHGSFNNIKNHLNKIEYYQSLFRASEAKDRAIVGANHDRVQFWSILNGIVMLFVAAVQVWLIRNLFEDNSKIGRMLRGRRH